MQEEEEKTRKLSQVTLDISSYPAHYISPLLQVCSALREEVDKVHAQRIEKVERKVSVKLIEKDPSKRVILSD